MARKDEPRRHSRSNRRRIHIPWHIKLFHRQRCFARRHIHHRRHSGTEAVWTDTSVPEPEKYYYRVVPFNDNGTSPASTTAVQSPWLGKDTGVSGVSGVTATVSPESETTVLLIQSTHRLQRRLHRPCRHSL